MGNFSSMKALTTISTVSSDHASRGSFKPRRSRQRATMVEVLPYPENWPCNVSTGFAFVATCLRLIDPLIEESVLTPFLRDLECSRTNHFSIKLPNTHRTISECSHSMSTDGSYPRVAFPSASVVPLTSTTWIKASACRKSSKNLFPKPRP